MAWDPSVLRKYSSTSHFRLLNQLRTEIRNNPLARNAEGALSLVLGRKGSGQRVPVEVRSTSSRSLRGTLPTSGNLPPSSRQSSFPPAEETSSDNSFRDRLRAIDMR